MNRGQVRGRGVLNRTSSGSSARTAAITTTTAATTRAKSPTPGPAMVSVNTGSRRARALQQLAAKRTRKSSSASSASLTTDSSHNAISDNMKATPKSTAGSRRVSLGTTPVSSSSASSRRPTADASSSAGGSNNTATPRTDPDWSSGRSTRSALGYGGAAVTPAAEQVTTASTAKSQHDGRYGSACIRIHLPPSSATATAAPDGGVGVLGMRIISRTDRTGNAVAVTTKNSILPPSSPQPLQQLKPVRLVPLHGENGALDRRYALPFLFGSNENGYDMNGGNDQDVESICDEIWGRGDRCTVVENVGLEGGDISLSLTTVNVLLLGMDAAILLRRCHLGDMDVRRGNDPRRGYCLYQPTSVSGGDLFVVPDTVTNVANNEEKIAAASVDTTAVAAIDENDDRQEIEMPNHMEEDEDTVTRASVEETAQHDDDVARPPASPSPPASPLQPLSLSELSEAYENCIGESGEPSPSDVATGLLPRYLLSENVKAAKASSSLASVYDVIRSEGLLPSKEKVVFEVRDGLAATDRREGLVRLVSAQVMIRLGLLVHGQDDFLGWYQNSFGQEADDDVLAAKTSKKKKKKKKSKKSTSSRSVSSPTEFFREQITELLSCVQFALPTTQTFADFLKEIVAVPFEGTLSETVSALFNYFEVEVPDIEAAIGEYHDDANRPDAEAADDMIVLGHSAPLQSEAKGGVSFPLLEESLKCEMDDESKKEQKTEKATDPDSPLFRRGSVDLARKSSNPLLANGKHTYIGSHFSNKLTNMSDLFREIEVPRASPQSMPSDKNERIGETLAGTKDMTDPSSRLLKKRPRPSSISSFADGDLSSSSKIDPQQSKKATPRPFAPATKSGFESSSGANRNHDNDRYIVKETPMKPSRRSRIFGTGSIVPETPARQPQRHSTHHLVAEVAALAAARNKKPRHR